MASLAEFLSMPMFGGPNARPVGLDELGNVAYRPVMGPDYRVVKQAPNRDSVVKGFLSQLMDAPGSTLGGLVKGAAEGTWDAISAPGRSWSDTVTYGDVANTAGLVSLPAVAGKYDPNRLGIFGGGRPYGDFVPASQETLETLSKRYPDAAMRKESYGVVERPVRSGVDVRISPEGDFPQVPARPGAPERNVIMYDPNRADLDPYVPEVFGEGAEAVDIGRNRVSPKGGAQRLTEIASPEDGVMFRGMSAEEFEEATKRGYFASRGDWNIGETQKGLTYWSQNPDTAESYAASFAPFDFKPTFERPAYVVKAKRPDVVDLSTEGEIGVPGQLPLSDVLGVYRGDVYAADPADLHIMRDWGGEHVSGSGYSPRLTWAQDEQFGLAETPRPRIRAYHGSPHDFDRFDLSKIGTGEGAQAYGHGLYFAEAENVAKGYREKLAGKEKPWNLRYSGRDVWGDAFYDLPPDQQRGMVELHARLSPYKDPTSPELLARTKQHLEATIQNFDGGHIPMNEGAYGDAKAALAVLNDPNFAVRPTETPGRMYEVDINADPADFLDWDAPLSEQPAKVRDALQGKTLFDVFEGDRRVTSYSDEATARAAYPDATIKPNGGTGGQVYALMDTDGSVMNRGEGATAALREAGIPGIKYYDQGSRAGKEGTRNYVVFDDSLIEILRKYGLAGAMLGAGVYPQEEGGI